MANKSAAVAGVILAGGTSSRMGSNKALLPYGGGRLIEAVYQQLASIFREIIVVTNTPEDYSSLPCRKVGDIFPGRGALAGIHAGLSHSGSPAIFVVACDMPYLDHELIEYLAGRYDPAGVVIPESDSGLEPLHAIYGRGCLTAMTDCLSAGKRRVFSFFDQVPVEIVRQDVVGAFAGGFDSFRNINTPADYFSLRRGVMSHAPSNNHSAKGEDECLVSACRK